jgi:CAAX protease family protein
MPISRIGLDDMVLAPVRTRPAMPPPPPPGRVQPPPPPLKRPRYELLGLLGIVVGYTVLMLLLFKIVLPHPTASDQWDRALTSASVARTYLPSAITMLVLLALVGGLGWWRQSGITSPPRLSPWGIVPVGVLTGAALVFGSPIISLGDETFLVTLLTGSLVWAFVEELQMRGLVWYGLARRSNPWRAAWLTTLIFALAHFSSMLTGWSFGHASAQAIAAGLDGGILAKVRVATRSLWFCTFVHGVSNFVVFEHRFAGSFGDGPYTLLRVSGWIVGIVLSLRFVLLDVRTSRLARRDRRGVPVPPGRSSPVM